MKVFLFYFLVDLLCSKNDFHCSIGNLECIPWLWVCDGDEDCTDGSDESNATCGLCHELLQNYLLDMIVFIHFRCLEMPGWRF